MVRKSDETNSHVKKEIDDKMISIKQDMKKQTQAIDAKLDSFERDKEKLKEELKSQIRELQKQKEKEREEDREKRSSVNVDDEWKVGIDESIRNLKQRQDLLKSLPDDVIFNIYIKTRNILLIYLKF